MLAAFLLQISASHIEGNIQIRYPLWLLLIFQQFMHICWNITWNLCKFHALLKYQQKSQGSVTFYVYPVLSANVSFFYIVSFVRCESEFIACCLSCCNLWRHCTLLLLLLALCCLLAALLQTVFLLLIILRWTASTGTPCKRKSEFCYNVQIILLNVVLSVRV